jgi:hypothetical protein
MNKTYNDRAREFAKTPELIQFRATITTVKQRLSGEPPTVVPFAALNRGDAERKLWDIVDTLEHNVHELSAYRIYEYALEEVAA